MSSALNQNSAGLLRDGKGSTWESGMRVPAIAWWPGRVKPAVTSEPANAMELFSTSLALAGVAMPKDRPIDGIDLSPLLLDGKALPKRPYFFYRGDELFACRLGEWKAHFQTQAGYGQNGPEAHEPPLLFQLGRDPSERFNIATNHPSVLAEIRAAVKTHEPALIRGEPQLR